MKKQTNPTQETHGKTTNHVSNKDKQQTNNKTLLTPKTGILVHTRGSGTRIHAFPRPDTLTRRRPHRDRRGPIFFF